MNIPSTSSNYFRTAAHVGVRQKVERRRPLDLPGGIVLWKAVGKVILWTVPLVLAANLWFSSAMNTRTAKIAEIETALQQLQVENGDLLRQVERLSSPVRVKIAAAEKLSLYEPEAGQIWPMR